MYLRSSTPLHLSNKTPPIILAANCHQKNANFLQLKKKKKQPTATKSGISIQVSGIMFGF